MKGDGREWFGWWMEVQNVPLFGDDALWCQAKDVQASISHQTEIGGRGHSNAGVEEGRVLDRVTFEALGIELEHCGR